MKRYILPFLLSAVMVIPLGVSAESRGNYHRQQNGQSSSSRPGNGNNSNRPQNNMTNNGNLRPGNNVNNKPNNGNLRPGNNGNNKPNNGNLRPGNNGNNKPNNGHGHKPDNDRWGGNSHNRPGGTAWGPATPGHGYGPGAPRPGNSYRPRPYNHPPRLGYMVNHAIGAGRYDQVWMVAPNQYAVRFYRNGYYYMQYIWPETGVYGTPFRVVMASPGQWYAYDNRNQWYYEDGSSLRISINGSFLNPWTLIPKVELNINL